MKRILSLFILFSSAISMCFSQNPGQDKLFAMIYTTGEKWNDTIPIRRQAYFKEHSKHLAELRKDGTIIMGGKYSDKGFMILKAKDIDEARSITLKDSSIIHGTFRVELYEFNTFYEGWVGKNSKTETTSNEARVTGIGGIFFKSKNPQKLRKWYKENLGILYSDEGTSFEWRKFDNPSLSGFTVWDTFKDNDDYFNIGNQEYMINYRVNNLELLLEKLKENGIHSTGKMKVYDYGKFAWVYDLEGHKIELWEPNDKVYDKITKQRMKSN